MENTRNIRSLAPCVTQADAIAAFERGIWRRVSAGSLHKVASAYLPFRLFEVEILNAGRRRSACYAADAVTGTLDLYEFEHVPKESQLVTVATANNLPALLAESRSRELIEGKVERAVFQAGFFRVRGLQVRARRVPLDIHVPYWLGFFGTSEHATLRAMDAVRRQMEGAKARALFEDWLLGRLGNEQGSSGEQSVARSGT